MDKKKCYFVKLIMILVLYIIDKEFEFLLNIVKVVFDIYIYVNKVICLFLFIIGFINFILFFVFVNVILNFEM